MSQSLSQDISNDSNGSNQQKILLDPIGSLRFVSGVNQNVEDTSAIVADAG